MIEMTTRHPPLTVRVYGQWEIQTIEPPEGRFIIVSITTTGRRADRVDLSHLGLAPVLRLAFSVGELRREQAVSFWEFINEHLNSTDFVLLHCAAGAVRSPALGSALVVALGGDDSIVWEECEPDQKAYDLLTQTMPKSGLPRLP